jgi:hypothetical protein
MTESEQPQTSDEPELEPLGAETAPEVPEHGSVHDDQYALGRSNDPDGAHREEEAAGEDYAGSGF